MAYAAGKRARKERAMPEPQWPRALVASDEREGRRVSLRGWRVGLKGFGK